MARGEDGVLIDPFGGAADLRAGVLRHVSPAFAEDPLRVLRVARFAARFGFAVAPETEALMRALVASGELATLAPERVWQELARGLDGAASVADARGAARVRRARACCCRRSMRCSASRSACRTTRRSTRACMSRARSTTRRRKGFALPVRYAVLVARSRQGRDAAAVVAESRGHETRSVRLAERMSARLQACRSIAATRAARRALAWPACTRRRELAPAALLDLLLAADALRRPERLDTLLEACECDALSRPGRAGDYAPAAYVRAALVVVKGVDAGAIARNVRRARPARAEPDDAIAKAVRAARLKALRAWRKAPP